MAGRKTTNKEKIEIAKKELETLSAILGKILDDTMTQTEAARKLGITPQEFRNETIGNFTNYVKKKNILTEDDILAYLKDMETPLDRVAKDMFNITLKLIFHFITFLVISFLYDSDDNLSERMEGSNYGTVMN